MESPVRLIVYELRGVTTVMFRKLGGRLEIIAANLRLW